MCSYPLSGVRVVDLSHYVAGPYCTKLFADWGADVIKIERPGRGDGVRWFRPYVDDRPSPERSSLFLYLNTNKRSVLLDLRMAEDVKILKDMVREADILVESFEPGRMAQLGIDYPTLQQINPRLVMTSVSNFGQTGPYRDWKASDIVLSALCGMLYMTGSRDRPPVKLALSQVQHTAGVAAAVATLAAYRQQQISGTGQYIDISILEPMLNTIHRQLARYGYWGAIEQRPSPDGFPFVFETKDGWIHASPIALEGLLDFVDLPELADPKFRNPSERNKHMGEIKTILEPWFRERSKFQLFHDAQLAGLPWAPASTEADLLECPSLRARNFFVEVDHPVAGKTPYPGRCFVSEQIPSPKPQPAPVLGQHTEAVLGTTPDDGRPRPRTFGWAESRASHQNRLALGDGAPNTPPLAGVRILSSEHWAILPHATKYLASLGAEVITVESTTRPNGDPTTRNTEFSGGLFNEGSRNKRAISLDLSKPRGRDLFKRLVKVCDVVADNFTPRVMKNFGLDYEALKEVKSDIIVLTMSGFGHKGPWYLYRGYATNIEAACGLAQITGYPDGPPTKPGGMPYGDIVPALHGAWAVLVALEHRNRTGQGAWIDLSMLEPNVCQFGEAIVSYSTTGRPQYRMGNRDHNAVPNGCYPCRGEDKWVAISAVSEEHWHSLIRLLGSPAWASELRFSTRQSRIEHQDEIDRYVTEWTRSQDNLEVAERCQKAGIPAGAALNVREVMTNEHLRQRGAFEVVHHPSEVGDRLHIAPPWKLSKTPASTTRPAPDSLGQDNEHIYRELLCLTDDEVAKLDAEGVIGREVARPARPPRLDRSLFEEHDEDYLEILGLR